MLAEKAQKGEMMSKQDGKFDKIKKKGKYTVSPEAIEARHKGTEVSTMRRYGLDQPPGENSKVTSLIIECQRIALQANTKDVSTLYKCLADYLQVCNDHDIRVTNLAAYMACGVDRETISTWENGRAYAGNPEYKRFARTIKNVCAFAREQYGVEGKINPVVLVWHQKNYDNFTDSPTVIVDNRNSLGEYQNASEIADKYKDMPDD